MARIELRQASKQFTGGPRALVELSLLVRNAETMCILGPSGSGKTTLLRAIAGLEALTSGQVLFDGQDVAVRSPKDRNVAMIFQQPSLYPHLNVFYNLCYPLRLRGESAVGSVERIDRVVARLKIEDLLDRRPATLSGGEAQRVALGRALVRRPNCLLMDEPFAALDAPLRAELRGELRRMLRSEPVTTLFVTHDQQEALALGDRLAVIDCGRLQQVGMPDEIYQRPVNRFVAMFIGTPVMNMLTGTLVLDEGRCWFVHGSVRLALADWQARQLMPNIGRDVVMGLRPHALQSTPWPMFSPAHSLLTLTAEGCESTGDRHYVQGRTNLNERLTGLVTSRGAIKPGECVALYANLSELHFFATGGAGDSLLPNGSGV